jgi:phospholipase/carboxylesterase
MWFFARGLPEHSWMVSPRAPLVCPAGGFAWGIAGIGKRPDIKNFSIQADELLMRLSGWVPEYVSGTTRLDVIGFSQGAAMAYTLCLKTSPVKTAPLAGYLPSGFSDQSTGREYSGLQMFIAHNVDDEMLPVEESRNARDFFSSRGADVQYCENTGGHKMSTPCLKALNVFMSD